MPALKKQLKQNLLFILSSVLLFAHLPVMAETLLRARAMTRQHETDHANHENHVDKSQEFRGVFYGFLPCNDCLGVKTTLSLKTNNNYLLVTQYTRESAREFFEKGKYTWDDETRTVVLTPRGEGDKRNYVIEDENTLVQLNSDGSRVTGKLADRYLLRRSDTVKSREIHFH